MWAVYVVIESWSGDIHAARLSQPLITVMNEIRG
jgi:hypothetical protein